MESKLELSWRFEDDADDLNAKAIHYVRESLLQLLHIVDKFALLERGSLMALDLAVFQSGQCNLKMSKVYSV